MLCVGCRTAHNTNARTRKSRNNHWQVFRALQHMIFTNRIHIFSLNTHIPGGQAKPVTGSPKLSSKNFCCSSSGIFLLASWDSKTEHLVFSAILLSDSPFSHLLRAPRLASSGWPGPLMHIPQDSTMRWEATSSHWLATRSTVSLPSSWSVGVGLLLRRVWAPGLVRGQ